ncbi:hypothetical protein D3C81_2054000 [compost metagenome]
MAQNQIQVQILVLDPVLQFHQISIQHDFHSERNLRLQRLNPRIVFVGGIIITQQQQDRLHLQVNAKFSQADYQIRMAVDRHPLVSQEHMHKIRQRIDCRPPFTDQ